MSTIAEIVGQRIRNFRTQREWSQEKLAEKADLHASYIGQIERAEKNATIESMEKISIALEIPMARLFQNLGGKVSDYTDYPFLCNELIASHPKEEQKLLYEILCQIEQYKLN